LFAADLDVDSLSGWWRQPLDCAKESISFNKRRSDQDYVGYGGYPSYAADDWNSTTSGTGSEVQSYSYF
jgi:hypothetical protein